MLALIVPRSNWMGETVIGPMPYERQSINAAVEEINVVGSAILNMTWAV